MPFALSFILLMSLCLPNIHGNDVNNATETNHTLVVPNRSLHRNQTKTTRNDQLLSLLAARRREIIQKRFKNHLKTIVDISTGNASSLNSIPKQLPIATTDKTINVHLNLTNILLPTNKTEDQNVYSSTEINSVNVSSPRNPQKRRNDSLQTQENKNKNMPIIRNILYRRKMSFLNRKLPLDLEQIAYDTFALSDVKNSEDLVFDNEDSLQVEESSHDKLIYYDVKNNASKNSGNNFDDSSDEIKSMSMNNKTVHNSKKNFNTTLNTESSSTVSTLNKTTAKNTTRFMSPSLYTYFRPLDVPEEEMQPFLHFGEKLSNKNQTNEASTIKNEEEIHENMNVTDIKQIENKIAKGNNMPAQKVSVSRDYLKNRSQSKKNGTETVLPKVYNYRNVTRNRGFRNTTLFVQNKRSGVRQTINLKGNSSIANLKPLTTTELIQNGTATTIPSLKVAISSRIMTEKPIIKAESTTEKVATVLPEKLVLETSTTRTKSTTEQVPMTNSTTKSGTGLLKHTAESSTSKISRLRNEETSASNIPQQPTNNRSSTTLVTKQLQPSGDSSRVLTTVYEETTKIPEQLKSTTTNNRRPIILVPKQLQQSSDDSRLLTTVYEETTKVPQQSKSTATNNRSSTTLATKRLQPNNNASRLLTTVTEETTKIPQQPKSTTTTDNRTTIVTKQLQPSIDDSRSTIYEETKSTTTTIAVKQLDITKEPSSTTEQTKTSETPESGSFSTAVVTSVSIESSKSRNATKLLQSQNTTDINLDFDATVISTLNNYTSQGFQNNTNQVSIQPRIGLEIPINISRNDNKKLFILRPTTDLPTTKEFIINVPDIETTVQEVTEVTQSTTKLPLRVFNTTLNTQEQELPLATLFSVTDFRKPELNLNKTVKNTETVISRKSESDVSIDNIHAAYILAALGFLPMMVIVIYVIRSIMKKKNKIIEDYETEMHDSEKKSIIHPVARLPTLVLDSSNKWEFPRSKLRLQTLLGQGNFGQVWKAEADDLKGHVGLTRLVAVKTIKDGAGTKERDDLLKELAIMQKMGSHPNVVTLLGCCTEKEPYLLIMEYVMYGKLLTFLRDHRTRRDYYNFSDDAATLTARDLTVFAYCVARGMEYLASKGIIHRDLAARNILVDHNKLCKIADFGMSRDASASGGEVTEPRAPRNALPVRWMAVESLLYSVFTHKTDVWAFGVLLWEIVTLGSSPYANMSGREVMRLVCDGYRLERPGHCRPELYGVMARSWNADPSSRPTFAELRSDLAALLEQPHPDGSYVDLESFRADPTVYEIDNCTPRGNYFTVKSRFSEFECDI